MILSTFSSLKIKGINNAIANDDLKFSNENEAAFGAAICSIDGLNVSHKYGSCNGFRSFSLVN